MGPRTRPVGRKVNSQHPLARGLVSFNLCLPNLTGGATWYDIVNHFDVTLGSLASGFGFQPSTRPGRLGSAVKMSGSTTAIRTASLPVSGFPLTFACWFLPSSFASGTEYALICLDDGSTSNQICLESIMGSGVPRIGAFLNNTAGEVTSSFGVGNVGWNFATATFAQNVQYAYNNGANKSPAGSAAGTPTGLTNFRIGGSVYNINLAGSIDCCMVYNRVLNDAEIMQLYIETSLRCPSLIRRSNSPKIFFTPPAAAASPIGVMYQFNQSVKSASFF